MEVKNVLHPYLPLHKAIVQGQHINAHAIIADDPSVLSAKITHLEETPLLVAIAAGHSFSFIEKLIARLPDEALEIPNLSGSTSLHYAANTGNTQVAKLLVEKNLRLTQARCRRDVPLHRAAQYAHRETARYLLSVTRDERPSPFIGRNGVYLLISLINAHFYDIALDVLKQFPDLALGKNRGGGETALDVLAAKSAVIFANGRKLGYFQRLLYNYFANRGSARKGGDIESQEGRSKENYTELKQFQFLSHIHSTLLMHNQAMELLQLLISIAVKASIEAANDIIGSATRIAATMGNERFVVEAIKAYPGVVWIEDKNTGETVFLSAVKHRQEKVYNLLYQMGTQKSFIISHYDKCWNNMLHLAGELHQSSKISGAALQMQRELQWFKEVEKFVTPKQKEWKNKQGKIPTILFTEEHKNLVEKGEKWMKDTATSCATVAALVLTVVFAAAFTVPGGNISDQGTPIFLNQTSFMIFAVSDALALFSSSTSLLMFLGMLTSRYSEMDFLRALPMRLSIGLITLFFSIASMLAAFSAAFYLVLFQRVNWIAVPIGLIACVPVTLFALLQFPLLVEIVYSTFGPSIFGKKCQEIIF